MTDNNKDENVVNLFSKNEKEKSEHVTKNDLKFYAGFNYVKVKKDPNGKKFRKDYLLKYRESIHYVVTVMREIDGEIALYSYDVPSSDIFKFMKSFDENTLDGTIIDMDKYFPQDLA